jgi:uncharacterized protein YpmS
MTQRPEFWKWLSGILASVLVTGAVSFAVFGLESNKNIAVIQEQQVQQNEVIKQLTTNETKILDLLARMDERIKHLEKGDR